MSEEEQGKLSEELEKKETTCGEDSTRGGSGGRGGGEQSLEEQQEEKETNNKEEDEEEESRGETETGGSQEQEQGTGQGAAEQSSASSSSHTAASVTVVGAGDVSVQQQYQQYQYQQYMQQQAQALGASSSHLDSILDGIDNTNKKRPANEATVGSVSSSPYDWSKQLDPATNLFYYYNYRTGVTQWEKPEGFIDYYVPPPTTDSTTDATLGTNKQVFTSTFNARTGSFSGTGEQSYWSRMGRATDREGRQMSAFFDLNDLERNREEAKRKKKEIEKMNKRGQIDWRQYKEEAKQKKKRQKNSWLYENDD